MEHPYQNKQWLEEQMQIHGSGRKIAEATGYSKTVIQKWMSRLGVQGKYKKIVKKKEYQNPEYIINELKSGKSIVDIANQFGVHRSTIDTVIMDNKIPASQIIYESKPYRNKEWLQSQFDEYGNGAEIAKATGYDRHTILECLREFGISKRKLNSVNEDFFEVIDTEEKAYWLGFMMADGYVGIVNKEKNLVYYYASLKLEANDEDTLIKFKKSIRFNGSLFYEDSKRNKKVVKSVKLSITNQKFCKDLMKHGIIQRKTGTEHIPQSVPKELLHHFVRGFFDGDGSIRWQDTGTKVIKGITFSSSQRICEELKELFTEIGVADDAIKINKHHGCSILGVYRFEEVKKIVSYMYQDATIWMDRKYEKAIKYIN